jgi:hypothetical protein
MTRPTDLASATNSITKTAVQTAVVLSNLAQLAAHRLIPAFISGASSGCFISAAIDRYQQYAAPSPLTTTHAVKAMLYVTTCRPSRNHQSAKSYHTHAIHFQRSDTSALGIRGHVIT